MDNMLTLGVGGGGGDFYEYFESGNLVDVTAPFDCNITIAIWGHGASGEGSDPGDGGGAGGFSQKELLAVPAGTIFTYTVPALASGSPTTVTCVSPALSMSANAATTAAGATASGGDTNTTGANGAAAGSNNGGNGANGTDRPTPGIHEAGGTGGSGGSKNNDGNDAFDGPGAGGGGPGKNGSIPGIGTRGAFLIIYIPI